MFKDRWENKVNKKVSSLLIALAATCSLGLAASHNTEAASSLTTKVIGSGNYPVYKNFNGKPSQRICSSSDFKNASVQSKNYKKSGNTRYYYIYVDGRGVGYVSEKAFARSKMNIAKSVSLVNNVNDPSGFYTRDAINYVTDSHGSAVNPNKVKVSRNRISEKKAGTYKVTYSYGSKSATSQVTVRSDVNEGTGSADINPVREKLPNLTTWYSSSKNDFTIKSKGHTYYGKDRKGNKKAAKLTTKFYEPNQYSLREGGNDTMVLTSVQGLDVYGNDLVTTNFNSGSAASADNARGRVVLYNLKKVNKTALQYLPTDSLGFGTWLKYVKNIKISPYIKLGHGQTVGVTKNAIYEIANWNHVGNSNRSNELLQINKKTMQIDHIWTFKVWNKQSAFPRYFLNADIVDDNTIIGLFHNAGNGCYEYWKITRNGDSFSASELAATGSNLMSNTSQVQGFTYNTAHNNYYIAFNDYIFKMNGNGRVANYYKFNTGREVEGLSSYKNKMYVGLNKRAEIMSANQFK